MLRAIPSPRCMSSKRRWPWKAWRRITRVQRSPRTATVRAMEHGWSCSALCLIATRVALPVAFENYRQEAGMRVRFDRDGDVGVLTLSDPPLNLFVRELLEDLHSALDEVERSDARALVVRAEGKVFTGGADVHMFEGLTGEQVREELNLIAVPHRLEALPMPTLAVVHALCLTAGFELALGCDLIWAAESAQFGLVEAVVGVTPFMGGTQRVAERAGPARAR